MSVYYGDPRDRGGPLHRASSGAEPVKTFAEDNLRALVDAAMDLQLDRLIAADTDGVPEAPDPDEVTLVDGSLTGTDDELADVVESIVIEQVAQFMAGRR